MKSTISKGMLAASLVFASSAYAMSGDGMYSYGEAVAPTQATRVITIGPDTKWVNVRDDDAVKFVDAQGNTFAWEFDNTAGETIALSRIAPPGFAAGKDIKVYVADPPMNDD